MFEEEYLCLKHLKSILKLSNTKDNIFNTNEKKMLEDIYRRLYIFLGVIESIENDLYAKE